MDDAVPVRQLTKRSKNCSRRRTEIDVHVLVRHVVVRWWWKLEAVIWDVGIEVRGLWRQWQPRHLCPEGRDGVALRPPRHDVGNVVDVNCSFAGKTFLYLRLVLHEPALLKSVAEVVAILCFEVAAMIRVPYTLMSM